MSVGSFPWRDFRFTCAPQSVTSVTGMARILVAFPLLLALAPSAAWAQTEEPTAPPAPSAEQPTTVEVPAPEVPTEEPPEETPPFAEPEPSIEPALAIAS